MQLTTNIFTGFRNKALALIVMVVLPAIVISQPVVKMGDTTGCSANEMLIPVFVENMENIAAITLYVSTDTNVVKYVGVEDVNEAFSSGDFIGGENGGNQTVILNWFSLTPANIEDGLMCNVRFFVKGGGSVNFDFQDNCEFIDPDLNVVGGIQYVNGSLTALNSLVPEPASQSVLEGNPVSIELSGTIEGISYQWQLINEEDEWTNLEDNTNYSGVTTPKLIINATADMNGNLYRCMLSNGACSDWTTESELTVTTSGLNEPLKRGSGLLIYPVPVNDELICEIYNDIISGKLVLTDISGRVLKQKLFNNEKSFIIQMSDITSGIYFIHLYQGSKLITSQKVLKN